MELKDKKGGSAPGKKALGAAVVANINPSLNIASPDHATTNFIQGDGSRMFSLSDLINLTLHQVSLHYRR